MVTAHHGDSSTAQLVRTSCAPVTTRTGPIWADLSGDLRRFLEEPKPPEKRGFRLHVWDRGDRDRTCDLWFWRPALCQLSYAPRFATECSPASATAYACHVQRTLLGVLFSVLALGLAMIAVYAALAGGRAWVVALAAGALAAWMGDFARRVLVRRRV